MPFKKKYCWKLWQRNCSWLACLRHLRRHIEILIQRSAERRIRFGLVSYTTKGYNPDLERRATNNDRYNLVTFPVPNGYLPSKTRSNTRWKLIPVCPYKVCPKPMNHVYFSVEKRGINFQMGNFTRGKSIYKHISQNYQPSNSLQLRLICVLIFNKNLNIRTLDLWDLKFIE